MKYLPFVVCFFLWAQTQAQGVGINPNGSPPDASAGLDVQFNNKGFLMPRLTTAERNAIVQPAEGLQIYNLTTKCFEAFFGTHWQSLYCGCTSGPTQLSYPVSGPLVYCANQSIAALQPTTQGAAPTLYSVSPVLPSGLFLQPGNGVISGTPNSATAQLSYIISASNACGSIQDTLQIQVLPAGVPVANAGADQTFGGTGTFLDATAPAAGTTGQWSILSGVGGVVDNPAQPKSLFTGSPGQTYTLRWTVTSPCGSAFDEVTLTLLTHNRAFVTNGGYAANFGGLAGGDSICQSSAKAAGLSGRWRAWLSSETTSAAARLIPSTLPYRLLNGTTIANNWADLTDGSLASPWTRNEFGQVVVNISTWTGTNNSGQTVTGQTCNNWSQITGNGAYGQSDQSSGTYWTHSFITGNKACSTTLRLYCVEQ